MSACFAAATAGSSAAPRRTSCSANDNRQGAGPRPVVDLGCSPRRAHGIACRRAYGIGSPNAMPSRSTCESRARSRRCSRSRSTDEIASSCSASCSAASSGSTSFSVARHRRSPGYTRAQLGAQALQAIAQDLNCSVAQPAAFLFCFAAMLCLLRRLLEASPRRVDTTLRRAPKTSPAAAIGGIAYSDLVDVPSTCRASACLLGVVVVAGRFGRRAQRQGAVQADGGGRYVGRRGRRRRREQVVLAARRLRAVRRETRTASPSPAPASSPASLSRLYLSYRAAVTPSTTAWKAGSFTRLLMTTAEGPPCQDVGALARWSGRRASAARGSAGAAGSGGAVGARGAAAWPVRLSAPRIRGRRAPARPAGPLPLQQSPRTAPGASSSWARTTAACRLPAFRI